MALQELPGTVDFLTDAAHLLRNTAPEISAHLMSQRSELMYQHGVPTPEIQKQHACGACGQIFVYGQESRLQLQSRRPKAKTSKLKKGSNPASTSPDGDDNNGSHKILNCEKCHRVTRISMGPPGPAIRRKIQTPVVVKKQVPSDAPKQTTNANSKKRAKNRKAGLQALLSGQKQQSTNPLSLSSFMR